MFFFKEEKPDGPYVDEEEKRFFVEQCRFFLSRGRMNDGWTEFPSLEAALEEWGLTYAPLPEPQPEN